MKKGVKFDYKQAYNKNLKPSARLHYLENARHDQDSPAKKYGSPMKMGSHSIHKHMGGSPFQLGYGTKTKNLEEDMPVVKDATGGRKTGTTGDPVMDAFNAKQKRKKEFEKTGKAKKAKVVEAKGASIKESGPSKEIIKAKPTVKKTEPKDNSRKAIRKRKKADKAAGVSKSQMRANKAKSKSEAALEKAKKAKNPSYRAQLKRKSDRLAKRAERKS